VRNSAPDVPPGADRRFPCGHVLLFALDGNAPIKPDQQEDLHTSVPLCAYVTVRGSSSRNLRGPALGMSNSRAHVMLVGPMLSASPASGMH